MSKVEIDLNIRALDKSHNFNNFSCGVERIDNFLTATAWREHKKHKVRVFAATKKDDNTVCGYYSLTFNSWNIDEKNLSLVKKFGNFGSIPSIYLAKLGVSKSEFNKGIGSKLIKHAFTVCVEISKLAGISTLTLHAIDESKISWYSNLGFFLFNPEDRGMAIPLNTIRNSIPHLTV